MNHVIKILDIMGDALVGAVNFHRVDYTNPGSSYSKTTGSPEYTLPEENRSKKTSGSSKEG